MRELLVINQSTNVPHGDVEMIVAALQKQIDSHVEPWWHVGCKLRSLRLHPETRRLTDYPENIRVVDSFAHLRLLGFHTVRPDGVPQGYVAPGTWPLCLDEVSESLSHELIEQLVNPSGRALRVVTLPATWGPLAGRSVAVPLEPADAVEEIAYRLDGVSLSNFVYPSWFATESAPPSNGYDFLAALKGPLDLAPGGYIDVTEDLRNWRPYGLRKQKDPDYSRAARRAMSLVAGALMFAGS